MVEWNCWLSDVKEKERERENERIGIVQIQLTNLNTSKKQYTICGTAVPRMWHVTGEGPNYSPVE